jgi:hypothetical protein
VTPLKREPQNAPAAIAGCAEKDDFHNRISSLARASLCVSPSVFYGGPTDWRKSNRERVAWTFSSK